MRRASEQPAFTQGAQLHFGRASPQSVGELGEGGARVLRHLLLARPRPMPLAKLFLADAGLNNR